MGLVKKLTHEYSCSGLSSFIPPIFIMPSKADIIEALLFASERPLTLKKLGSIVDLSPREVQAEIDMLREEKERIGAIGIIETALGWQLVSKAEYAPFIAKLRDEKRQRLSRAAFEVLAIVAYRQPVTRADVEALRGVDCAGSLQFLLEKKLVAFAGRKDAPGRPWLYETTPQFLDHFGLRHLADLPSLSELAELNHASQGAAHEYSYDGQSEQPLFNRGAMKSAPPEEGAPEDLADENDAIQTQTIEAFEDDAANEADAGELEDETEATREEAQA